MLAFDISQFFPLLNYQLLLLIIDKVELNCKVMTFFNNYLVGRKTKYLWNNFLSPSCSVDVGVGQESALSLILSALYLSPIFHILEKHLKNLKIPISIISFVNDSLFISQNKSISHLNTNNFCSYNTISSLLMRFELVVEHGKTEVFHFSRSHKVFNSSPLNLTAIGGSILLPKGTITKSLWTITSAYYERYNEELLFGYQCHMPSPLIWKTHFCGIFLVNN